MRFIFRVINSLQGPKFYTSRSFKYQELYVLENNLVIDLLVRESLEKPANYEFLLLPVNQPKCQTYLCVFFFLISFSFFFSAAPVTYGSFQARGPIGAAAASLCHSHSNVGSEPHLQTTAQIMATLDH